MKNLSFSLLITSVLASLVLVSPVTAATPTTIVRDITNDTIVSSCLTACFGYADERT
jgi:hypothetical protein